MATTGAAAMVMVRRGLAACPAEIQPTTTQAVMRKTHPKAILPRMPLRLAKATLVETV